MTFTNVLKNFFLIVTMKIIFFQFMFNLCFVCHPWSKTVSLILFSFDFKLAKYSGDPKTRPSNSGKNALFSNGPLYT